MTQSISRSTSDEVARVDGLQGPAPEVEDPLHGAVAAAAVDEVDRALQVLPLDLQGGGLATVGELDLAATGRVVADLADRPDRVLQRQVAEDDVGLDHPQHQVGRADLQQRRGLGHVRVPDDDVQPAEPLGVGVRLVAGVDDRAGCGWSPS